jgi:hypothetical protein
MPLLALPRQDRRASGHVVHAALVDEQGTAQVGQRRSASVMAECVENCGKDRAEHPWLGADADGAGDDARAWA